MLEVIKKNRISIVMVILFGVVGILGIPAILGIEKFSKKYPKAFKGIAITIYFIIMAVCMCFLVIKHQMIYLPIWICMVMGICNTAKTSDK